MKYEEPSVRTMKMGAFIDNTAKSFWEIGFFFNDHESEEEIVLSGLKAIKNRYRGIYISSSYDFTIRNSLIADNAGFGIQTRSTDTLQILDTTIIGYTPETKDLVKPPYFRYDKYCKNYVSMLSNFDAIYFF